MKEIVNRLHENRQIETAKSILESAGYKVTKEVKRVRESQGIKWYNSSVPGDMYKSVSADFDKYTIQVIDATSDGEGISFEVYDNDEDDVIYYGDDYKDIESAKSAAIQYIKSISESASYKVLKESQDLDQSLKGACDRIAEIGSKLLNSHKVWGQKTKSYDEWKRTNSEYKKMVDIYVNEVVPVLDEAGLMKYGSVHSGMAMKYTCTNPKYNLSTISGITPDRRFS